MVLNLVTFTLLPAQRTYKVQERWRAVSYATFHSPLGRDLTQVSVRFRTSTVGLHEYSKFTAALQLELQVLVTWPDSSGLSALMRKVRCDCLIKSLPDLSDPPIRVGPAPLSAVSIPSVLPLTPSVSVRKSTSIRPRVDVNEFLLCCTSCELETSFSN